MLGWKVEQSGHFSVYFTKRLSHQQTATKLLKTNSPLWANVPEVSVTFARKHSWQRIIVGELFLGMLFNHIQYGGHALSQWKTRSVWFVCLFVSLFFAVVITITTRHASCRIGRQRSSSTPDCDWPASGWCPVRCPSLRSWSSFLLPQIFAMLSSVDHASGFPVRSSGFLAVVCNFKTKF